MRKMTDRQLKALRKNSEESHRLTLEAIQEAVFILLKKHDFSNITVTDIIKKAGVSRSAFYRNFKDKESILYGFVDSCIEQVFFNMDQSIYKNWVRIFQIVRNNQGKFNLLYRSRLWHRYLMMFNTASDFYNGKLYVDTLWRGMIFNTILSYIENGYPDPETTAECVMKSMDILCRQITSEGINEQYRTDRTYRSVEGEEEKNAGD